MSGGLKLALAGRYRGRLPEEIGRQEQGNRDENLLPRNDTLKEERGRRTACLCGCRNRIIQCWGPGRGGDSNNQHHALYTQWLHDGVLGGRSISSTKSRLMGFLEPIRKDGHAGASMVQGRIEEFDRGIWAEKKHCLVIYHKRKLAVWRQFLSGGTAVCLGNLYE